MLVSKPKDLSPLRRSLTIEASQEVKLLSFIVETVSSRALSAMLPEMRDISRHSLLQYCSFS